MHGVRAELPQGGAVSGEHPPGRRLYEGFGFDWRGDFDLTYPTTGTIPFSMYELALGDGSGAGRTLRDGRERR